MASKTNRNTRSNLPATTDKPNGLTRSNNDTSHVTNESFNKFSKDVMDSLKAIGMKNTRTMDTLTNALDEQGKLHNKYTKAQMELQGMLEDMRDQGIEEDKIRDFERKQMMSLMKSAEDDRQKLMEAEEKRRIEEQSRIFDENTRNLQNVLSKTDEIVKKNESSITGALFGQFSLLTKPIEEFTGLDFGEMFRNKIFGNKGKKNPNENDVAKVGVLGVGFLYLGNVIDKLIPKENKEGDVKHNLLENLNGKVGGLKDKAIASFTGGAGAVGFLKNMLPSALGGGGFGTLAKGVIGGGGILSGLIMMITDGIKAVISNTFGASKISTFFGGFLGGMNKGIKGIFTNMGKWALLGAGIGTVVPVVGTLIGGLIGAGIGALLGAIGGKKIAQGFDALGNMIKNFFMSIPSFFAKLFEKIKEGFTKGKDFVTKILGKKGVKKLLLSIIFPMFGAIQASLKVSKIIGNLVSSTMDKFKGTQLGQFVSSLLNGIGMRISAFLDENPLGKWINDSILAPMKNALGTIGDVFEFIHKGFEEKGIFGGFQNIGNFFNGNAKTGKLSGFEEWKHSRVTTVDDAIIRNDGSVIKTNPRDTLVALKNIPVSVENIRSENQNVLTDSLSRMNRNGNDGVIAEKLDKVVNVLKKILDKEEVKITLPSMTRQDLDLIMSGGMI